MITFIADSTEFPDIDREAVSRWVAEVAGTYGRHLGPISYIFCNDDKILEVNRRFLAHDYYTDIITFDYTSGRTISGDLFISLDTVGSNAQRQGVTYDEELRRVIIHGILHLCGINDKGPGEREIMEAAENQALSMFQQQPDDEPSVIQQC